MKKVYGSDETNLTLSADAYYAYSATDPLEIVEIEQDDGGFLYQMRGAYNPSYLMTAEEVNEYLEEEAAEIRENND